MVQLAARRFFSLSLLALGTTISPLRAQETSKPVSVNDEMVAMPLRVAAGTPLRLYVTGRVPLRIGQPVQAKVIEPVYAFDRIVVPAGSDVTGTVTSLQPIPKMARAQAIVNGDFTPLHTGLVTFTSVRLPDGRQVDLHTTAGMGLRTLYSPTLAKKKQQAASSSSAPAKTGTIATARQQVKDRIAETKAGVIDVVRGPNKKEWLEDYLVSKLPYHPQWYRRNTRFDAVLSGPLEFGDTKMTMSSLKQVGGDPAPDSVAHVRLLAGLSSGDAQLGQAVSGVLSEPLFSADHLLVLPEGTQVTGAVRQVQKARWFHRGGRLRFTFDHIEPSAELLAKLPKQEQRPALISRTTMTQLVAAEVETKDANSKVKVDEEGTAKATESKKRLIGPAIALIVAGRSLDNDADRHAGSASVTSSPNYGGRTAGGFSGFGLLGSAAAQASRTVGSVLGVYGLGWSVYSTIISRGQEVEFRQNAPVEIRFTNRLPAPAVGHQVLAAGAR